MMARNPVGTLSRQRLNMLRLSQVAARIGRVYDVPTRYRAVVLTLSKSGSDL
jgi:hypothetical protein